MAIGKDWDEHFDKVSPETLGDLIKALDTLKMDDMFLSEFKSTGLFSLGYNLRIALDKK